MRKIVLIMLLGAALLSANLVGARSGTITHGPTIGEVTDTSAVVWARGDMEAPLTFEIADNPAFEGDLITASVELSAESDFVGEALIEGLTPATAYHVRASLPESEPVIASFHTAPASDDPAAFKFTFGACEGGQGYCRNPETGWTIFKTMLDERPDFFLLTGDSVYVDSACASADGKNVPGAEGPYTDLNGFRTRYRYHLEDPQYAALLAQTPVYVTWDDHEILDNFSGAMLKQFNPRLFEEGRQAFFEYWPITGTEDDPFRMYRDFSYGAQADFFILDTRSYRDPIVNWDPNPVTMQHKSMLGADQFAWLQTALAESDATWKFIVSSVPLAYPTGFPQPQVDGRDSWANGADASGYETELMALLFFVESHGIKNVVFLTGDAHWPYAISYDPDRDGTPDFYELSSSPMSAIPLAPPALIDMTFNPTVLYAEGEFMGDLFNFGAVTIGDDGALTFRVIHRDGDTRYEMTLTPE